eukprot:13561948-Ditylum_brightwellii.AAC.1
MANKKAPIPSGITSVILESMVWTEENPGDDDNDDDNAEYLATFIQAIINHGILALHHQSQKKMTSQAPISGDLFAYSKLCT